MPFEHPHTTVVETKDLRQLLAAIEAAQLEQAEKLAKHILGLDREHHQAQD